jgi:hypothetical protein
MSAKTLARATYYIQLITFIAVPAWSPRGEGL